MKSGIQVTVDIPDSRSQSPHRIADYRQMSPVGETR